MRRYLVLLLAVIVSTITLAAPPAQASVSGFGLESRQVAREIGCRNFTPDNSGDHSLVHTGGICYLHGARVNVITFVSWEKQRRWRHMLLIYFPVGFYWASGRGVVIVAKYGSKHAAELGAKAIHGHVWHIVHR